MPDGPERPDPPRYVVVGGGQPTAEQVAALTVALTPVVVREDGSSEPSGWVRAALYEGLGLGTFASPAELELHAS